MAGLLPTNENERNYLEEIKAALARSGQETSQPQEGSYQPISRSDYPLRNRGKMGLMSEVPPVIEAMGKAGLPITLRGTSKGVGLYAGDETEPIHRTTPEGKTEPYYVASAPPPPPPPAPEVNTVERVNADFKQRQEKYLEAKRNQAAIIQKGYQLGYSSKQIEDVLKTKGFDKITEPKHSSWEEEILKSDLRRQEEERKKGKGGAGDISKTIETAKGIFQFNPDTERYDIFVDEGKETGKTQEKEVKATTRVKQQGEVVTTKIDEALEKIGTYGLTTTGLTGAIASQIPGRDAYKLNKILDVIRANIGFDELRKMRAESPTGGALGQVSEKEIDFLQSTLASLDVGIGVKDLTRNLGQIKATYAKVLAGIKEEEDRRKGLTPSSFSDMPAPSQHKGRMIEDDTTGKKYRSDGQNWVEVE